MIRAVRDFIAGFRSGFLGSWTGAAFRRKFSKVEDGQPAIRGSIQLEADNAEAGVTVASSIQALIDVARSRRDDQVLASFVGWLCSSFEKGSEISAGQLLASFDVMVSRASRSDDSELLRKLERARHSWARLVEVGTS